MDYIDQIIGPKNVDTTCPWILFPTCFDSPGKERMGHQIDVVAEQIKPLTREDKETIHGAQTVPFRLSYDDYLSRGSELLSTRKPESLISTEIAREKAYRFLAVMEGIAALREHLIYRKIQDKKYLSVDEAKKISLAFMKMPHRYKRSVIDYFDDLLLPAQIESGTIQKNELDLICQNISGALFGTIKALKDHTLLGILSRERFGKLLESSEPYCYDLIYKLYHILPDRMRNLNDKYRNAMEALTLIADSDGKTIRSIKQTESNSISNRLFKLNEEEVLSVFKDLRSFDKDQVIFEEGDHADGAYYLSKGEVKTVTLSSDLKEVILGRLGKGEIFGEMALIDNKPRSATIRTITPCKAAFIPRGDFNEFIPSRSELSFRFMAYICLSLFRRILRLDRSYAEIKKAFE